MKATSLKTAALLAGSIALLAGNATAQATATSGVVGYETVTLQPNQYNLFGARLHGVERISGTFDANTANTLTDTGADFSTLVATTQYIAELADGATIHFEGSDILADSIILTGAFSAAELQDYVIRDANTLNSVLGSPPVLTASTTGGPAGVDIVWVPEGLIFKKYYYVAIPGNSAFDGWYDVDLGAAGGKKGDTAVIDPGSAVYIQTLGSTVGTTNVIVAGDLKTTPTAFGIDQEWNLIGSAYPVGESLDESGLSTYVLASTTGNSAGADIVWVPSGLGFTKYFYVEIPGNSAFDGWYDVDLGAGGGKKGTDELSSAFYIQDTDGVGGGAISPPTIYSGL